jgi:hypothetical protein
LRFLSFTGNSPVKKVKIRWQSKKLQIQGAQILRNDAYLQYAAVTKDAAQRSPSTLLRAVSMSNGPSALLRAMSPSTLLRTVSLSNGLSNGSWTFYEAINTLFHKNTEHMTIFIIPPHPCGR